MTMNLGGGYPMVGGMNSMMTNNYSTPIMGSVPQSYLSRYGCEDCFRKEPYPYEFPKPYMPVAKDSFKPSLWQRLIHKFLGE